MAEPILKKTEVVYYEEDKRFTIEINGKEVHVQKYNKQDSQFNDYDSEIRILEETLSEEEYEQVYEFVEELE